MNIQRELARPNIEGIVELFDLDFTVIGGSTVVRFSPHISTPTLWRGNEYLPLPIAVSNVNRSIEGAPPRISFSISNINRTIMNSVLTLGDIVGAKLTRWKTIKMFLDGEPSADPNEHWPIEIYNVIQLTELSKSNISFTVGTQIDLPNRMIPRRQILRDDVEGALYAPSAGLAGWQRR